MSNIPENQIGEWLKKLERESWQLELLVSAFTIFLLIQAGVAFDEFLVDLQYKYNLSHGGIAIGYIFLALLNRSLEALTIFLVGHLMLRGFWIGTIGLRSVQSDIDFSRLNYNEFFTEKLKKKVISLDQLVIKLDEICSVIFAFAFLIISMLVSFGLYLVLQGGVAVLIGAISDLTPISMDTVMGIFALTIITLFSLSGLMYMIDYFTLGFFKKIKWLRKIYYPIYRFYSLITLAVLSRSIYYYLISKFTKRRIRIIYALVGGLFLAYSILGFDQYQYYPGSSNNYLMQSNYYDDLRPEDEYIDRISIPSKYLDEPHFSLFLRYDPNDNAAIESHCPDFIPKKEDGLNWRFSLDTNDGGFQISSRDYSGEEFETLLSCQSSMYEVSVNDSIYTNLGYYFYEHPAKGQKGLLTTIPTDAFVNGENILTVQKIRIDSSEVNRTEFARVPFWYKQ